jgi:2-dehydropantoate 2-reductase
MRLGNFEARPPAVHLLQDAVDVLFVATKATGLIAALERIEATPGLVVPLLNGLDHMVPLRERFGPNAVAGSIRIESDRPATGLIVQTSPFLRVDMASDDDSVRAQLPPVEDVLETAGIPAKVEESEAKVLWGKLVRLNALACTTAATDRELGYIRSDPQWRPILEACVREGCAVAAAEGAPDVNIDRVLGELDAAHESLGSSMQRDIAAGRVPELDAIAGAVLRAAARHGIETPAIAGLARQIAAKAGIAAPIP